MTRAGWLLSVASLVAALASVVAWQKQPSTEPAPSTLADGASLFSVKGCAACHDGPDSTARTGSQFPSLDDASLWAGGRRADLTAAQYLSESIRRPWASVSPAFTPGDAGPTAAMPALGLSDDEIAAIVEYLLSDQG